MLERSRGQAAVSFFMFLMSCSFCKVCELGFVLLPPAIFLLGACLAVHVISGPYP